MDSACLAGPYEPGAKIALDLTVNRLCFQSHWRGLSRVYFLSAVASLVWMRAQLSQDAMVAVDGFRARAERLCLVIG